MKRSRFVKNMFSAFSLLALTAAPAVATLGCGKGDTEEAIEELEDEADDAKDEIEDEIDDRM